MMSARVGGRANRVGFVARHAMVAKVRGQFDEFEGSAVVDGADFTKSTVSLSIQVASIGTRSEQRDGHLRSNDFLSMEEYPQIYGVTWSATLETGGVLVGDKITLEFEVSAIKQA